MLATAPKPWYSYRDLSAGTGDGPIGRPLPKANYCRASDLPGDPNFPAAIHPHDYGGPGWLLAPVETAAIRDLSEIDELLRIYEQQLLGLDYYDGSVWSIRDWANRLAEDWYGKPYNDLTDYNRRRQIRCAILGSSRKAYLLLYVANAEDIEKLSRTQSVFAGITGTLLAAVCAASKNPIICIIAGIFAAVSGVVAIATRSQLEQISEALLRGEDMDQTDRQVFCENFTTFFSIADVVWDTTRQALVSQSGDPETTANLEQINATISQIVAQTQDGIEMICEILAGVELQPLDPEGPPLPAEPAYTPPAQCPPGFAMTKDGNCVRIPTAPGGAGAAAENFLTQKIGGVPVWAALGIGWVLFSGGYLGGARTSRRRIRDARSAGAASQRNLTNMGLGF